MAQGPPRQQVVQEAASKGVGEQGAFRAFEVEVVAKRISVGEREVQSADRPARCVGQGCS